MMMHNIDTLLHKWHMWSLFFLYYTWKHLEMDIIMWLKIIFCFVDLSTFWAMYWLKYVSRTFSIFLDSLMQNKSFSTRHHLMAKYQWQDINNMLGVLILKLYTKRVLRSKDRSKNVIRNLKYRHWYQTETCY